PTLVEYVGALRSYRAREVFARAHYDEAPVFAFSGWLLPEQFAISVQTCVKNTPDRERLLELAGGVMSEAITTSSDDGVSQTVAVKSGISLVAKKRIENPFTLAPYRTFAEIEPVPAPFILRARQTKPGE